MGTESTGMQSVYTEVLMAPQGPAHVGIHSIDTPSMSGSLLRLRVEL